MHAELQQTPSTQLPVKHSVPSVQVCPLTFLHPPMPSHVLVPLHVLTGKLSCVPEAMFPHVPLIVAPEAIEHAWHVPEQAVSQQRPSTQFPLAQLAATVHVWPCPLTHRPVALQAPVPVHALTGKLSCEFCAMFPHVPLTAAPAAVEHA